MKVFHLNYSDVTGGAARAAYRIHQALRSGSVDSTMLVNVASSGDWTVQGPPDRLGKVLGKTRSQLVSPLVGFLKTKNPIIHSPAILPSAWVKRINASDAEVIHLHWIAGEMLSVEDVGRINKPVVWTLHDMWAFCGAEHLAWDERWREGYLFDNRPSHESGFDLNRWTWGRKRKHWKSPMHIVTPSRWLGECARQSVLMRDWPVSVIPNCVDTDLWSPVEQTLARDLLNLKSDVPLLLFGTSGANAAHHKGFDLLMGALSLLRGKVPRLELVVFGQIAPQRPHDFGFPVHYIGNLHDDISMRLLYSAADAMIIPSRQDNLPNTGVEAAACGTPVVAFATCGLPDIVEHQVTGYLAVPFDIEDLARGINWVLSDRGRQMKCREESRLSAVSRFASPDVASQYTAVYEQVLRCKN